MEDQQVSALFGAIMAEMSYLQALSETLIELIPKDKEADIQIILENKRQSCARELEKRLERHRGKN
jgi:hypothetical protein